MAAGAAPLITLTAGTTYTIKTSNITSDPMMHLMRRNSGGETTGYPWVQIAWDDDSDGTVASKIVYKPSVSGTYAVPELLPEITSLRTVAVTTDPCQRGRRGLEVTLASTQTVVLRPGENQEVSIDGEPYTVAAQGVGDPAPGTCDSTNWVLFRTSFVHIAK